MHVQFNMALTALSWFIAGAVFALAAREGGWSWASTAACIMLATASTYQGVEFLVTRR